MPDHDDVSPAIFDELSLTDEERAKVDVLKANWKRFGSKAIEDFFDTELSLFVRALEHHFGTEAVRDVLIEEMNEIGMTMADLESLLKRKPH